MTLCNGKLVNQKLLFVYNAYHRGKIESLKNTQNDTIENVASLVCLRLNSTGKCKLLSSPPSTYLLKGP
jgi:hypothetical protein